MNSEFESRLHDIQSGPWREQSKYARDKLVSMTDSDASRYLRDHRTQKVVDPDEIEFREAYDLALEELQILELACCSGYLPLHIVQPTAEAECATLLRTAAAREYVRIYDFVPVRFLASRFNIDLGFRAVSPPPVDPRAGLRFATFLALHSEFVASPTIERFTELLDDYRFAGLINARFFVGHLSSPSTVLTEGQQKRFQQLCVGFVEFLQIIGDLFLQLEPEEVPLYGCMYAYWLSHFFGLRRTASGYVQRSISFEDVDPSAVLTGIHDASIADAEHRRLRSRIDTVRRAWNSTRQLVESVDMAS
jgi:hypothetical protein